MRGHCAKRRLTIQSLSFALMMSTKTVARLFLAVAPTLCGAFLPLHHNAFSQSSCRIPNDPSRAFCSGTLTFAKQPARKSSKGNVDSMASAYIDSGTVVNGAGAGSGSGKKPKLSRPERKARERQKNEQAKLNARKKRNRRRPTVKDQGEGKYSLHSTAVSKLTKESTAEEVIRAIKRAQKLHDEHDIRNIERFLLEEVDESFAYGYRGSLLARLAVAALHMNNNELARVALEVRRREHRPSMLPLESAAVIRGLLRVHNVTDAMATLEDELSLPLKGTALDTDSNRDRLLHRALAISSIASRHFYESEPEMAVKACNMLTELGPMVRLAGLTAKDVDMPWLRIIQGAALCEAKRREGLKVDSDGVDMPCNLVYSVLTAMNSFPSDNNDAVYEALSNALVRRTVFLTGAVDVSGLPEADRGEAAFIGRSNVGKSSLVNMLTNRKSLAYTSKRPGKTQQFNFFAVNDKPEKQREVKYGDVVEGEKDRDSFYIVDLPGFGFAKVPQQQRQKWADFMDWYLANRKTLRVVFHLVDARHGPTHEDERIMKQAGLVLPKHVEYVVVLTKADKNVKGSSKNPGKVSSDVLTKLRDSMRDAKIGDQPVILTSAETKLGRDDMWRYLRLAAES